MMKSNKEARLLTEFIEIIGGGTPKTSNPDYWNGNIPWISIKDITHGEKYITSTEKSISEEGLKHSNTTLLKENDIIISARGTVGEIGIVSKPMAFNQSCYGIRAKENLNQNYLYYYLTHIVRELKSQVHGTVFDTITRATFENINIHLPSLAEQKNIADFLSLIDDKILVNKKINKNLLEIAKAIYKDHFVDFSFNGGIQPSNWINGCIKDLSSQIITGKTPSTKDKNNYGNEVPFITIPDMHDSIYVVNTERYLSEKGALTQENKFLPKNSICVSCIGTSGLVSLVSQESQTNQQINSIIPKKDLSPYFIYLSMKYLSKNKNAFSVGGSTIDNLNKGQFEKIDIVIPTADILQKFHKIAKPIFDLILKNQMEIISLNKLKNFILPKLLSGEIEL